GHPTHDPHRITFVVPTPDDTVLSLGHGVEDNPKRIKDTGITGRTNTHIHFHTKTPQTMLLLGGKTEEGWAGFEGNLLEEASGHMLRTDAHSWSESKGQMVVLSSENDVIVRTPRAGKKVLVEADEGEVWMGGEGVLVGGKNEVSIYASTSL